VVNPLLARADFRSQGDGALAAGVFRDRASWQAGGMTTGPLFVGMSGRVGRLIRPALPPDALCARRTGAGGGMDGGMDWDILAGPAPLLGLADRIGPPRALVMLAGNTPATGSDMTLNVALAQAAMQAARAAGVGRVLLASSSAVYAGHRDSPWHEGDAPAPAGAYGAAKLAMEAAAAPFRDAGLSVCALRIGNVAGADALLLNAPGPIRLDRFAEGEAATTGDGPVRSYIGPATLARVLLALSNDGGDLPPVLNLAAPRPVTMQALTEAAGMEWTWVPAGPKAARRVVLDCAALAARVHFDDTDSDPAAMVAQWRAARRAG
jgi:UDP-glucose 4-epimerase